MEYVNTKTKIDYLIHICTAIMISSFIIFDMDYRVSYILLGMTILIFGLLALRNNFKIVVKIDSFHKYILAFIKKLFIFRNFLIIFTEIFYTA